jgi:hypothetical protein
MQTKFSLQPRYENVQNNSYVKFLFCEIIEIPDASVDDLIEELRSIQDIETPDFDHICNIYGEIHTMAANMDDSGCDRLRYVKHSLL